MIHSDPRCDDGKNQVLGYSRFKPKISKMKLYILLPSIYHYVHKHTLATLTNHRHTKRCVLLRNKATDDYLAKARDLMQTKKRSLRGGIAMYVTLVMPTLCERMVFASNKQESLMNHL